MELGSARRSSTAGSAGGAFPRSSSRFIPVDDGGSAAGAEDPSPIKLPSKSVTASTGGAAAAGSAGADRA